MTLDGFGQLLTTLGVMVFHYHADKSPDRFIRWSEYDYTTYNADDVRYTEAANVGMDYFTKTEGDPLPSEISELFNANGIPFSGPIVDYERDTGYIHYIYDCGVIQSRG